MLATYLSLVEVTYMMSGILIKMVRDV
jgi:hypothetical protein